MAISTAAAAVVVVLLSLIAITSARPCKTIFFFSTPTAATATFYPYGSIPGNPNSHFLIRSRGPRYLTVIFSSSAARFHDPSSINPDLIPNFDDVSRMPMIGKPSDLPVQFYPSISNSIRERSRDIMSVVGALLFGVGCGGLTAAIMYFLWLIFSPCRLHGEDSETSDDDEVNEIKKKLGYMMIPSQPKVIEDNLNKAALVV